MKHLRIIYRKELFPSQHLEEQQEERCSESPGRPGALEMDASGVLQMPPLN